MSRNPIVIAGVVLAALYGTATIVRDRGASAPSSQAADSLQLDARASSEAEFVPVVGRAAAPSDVLLPRLDWPLRGVEVPEQGAEHGALGQAGLSYGDAGGVFVWRWTPPEVAPNVRPVVLEVLVYRAGDYAALAREGRAAPTLVSGRTLVVAYHQPRSNPFPSHDPRHAARESLRLTRLDLVDFAGKVRDKLRGRDPTLTVDVELRQ